MAKEVILIAGKDPCGERGGHSSFVRSTARAAIRLGFTPHIFCSARQSGETVTDFGVIHKTASPLRSFRQTTLPFHAPMIAAEVERFLSERAGPHLIHSFSVWGYAGVIVSRELRRRGRHVTTVVNAYTTMEHEAVGKLHGLNATYGRFQRLQHWAEYAWFKLIGHYERRAYLESDLVMVNYESVRRLLVEKYGAGLKIHKLTYAPESAFLQAPQTQPLFPSVPYSLLISSQKAPFVTESSIQLPEHLAALGPPDAPLIVSVSRHDPRKGVDVLLRALAELRKAGARFRACVLSGGPLYAAHRRLAEQLELGETAILTGWVSDPAPYLQFADIFVLPSLEEGSGAVSLLEALQAGVAVVASNIDGVPEDVTDGDSALLVEPRDTAALSRALERLVKDPALRERLARRGRETFTSRFSAEAFTEALRAVYTKLGFECAHG